MTILVTGASGMVGSHVLTHWSSKHSLLGVSHRQRLPQGPWTSLSCDLTQTDAVLALEAQAPKLIFHAAAMTNIGECERCPDHAEAVNVEGTRSVARLAKACGATLVYLSTDAVFDGDQEAPYDETSLPTTKTVYGKTKAKAENVCLDTHNDTFVIRTTLFGKNCFTAQSNLATTILNQLQTKTPFYGFHDAFFCPLYVGALLDAIEGLIATSKRGIYHLVSPDYLSKYEFAKQLAIAFHLDETLIRSRSVSEISMTIPYPKKLHLINTKCAELPSVLSMVNRFYKETV